MAKSSEADPRREEPRETFFGIPLSDAQRYANYALLGVLICLAYLVRAVFPLFLLGFFLAYIIDPFLDRLQQRGWPRRAAAILVFGVLAVLFLLAALIIVPLIADQAYGLWMHLGEYRKELVRLSGRGEKLLRQWNAPPAVMDAVREGWRRIGSYGPRVVTGVGGWLVGSVSSLLVLVLLPIITFSFMMEIDTIKNRSLVLVPPAYRSTAIQVSTEINVMLGQYVRGYIAVSALVGIAVAAVASVYTLIFGMQYALLLGLVAALTYVVPFIGPMTSAGLGAAIGYFTTGGSWTCAALMLVSVIVVNQTFDNLVTPKLVGSKVGLHPLLVIFALMAGGHLMGILGMLLAVPVAASIKLVLIHLYPELTEPVEVT